MLLHTKKKSVRSGRAVARVRPHPDERQKRFDGDESPSRPIKFTGAAGSADETGQMYSASHGG